METTESVITPKHGVVTLFGYGSSACVDNGHLVLEDGIGPERRHVRLPRVGHNLKRLVVIGSSGMVSFEALRWLADQNAAFVMLDRTGTVLATTGPICPSDARLRRAQSLAHKSGIALPIAKELIRQKLIGQERVLVKYFPNADTSEVFVNAQLQLSKSRSADEIRLWEAKAAKTYWAAWRKWSISFPKRELSRVPEHWKVFGNCISPITSSPRLAANPPNAMLNYLYAVLESESRLALAALGLDPGIGVLHNDLRTRDSLACDLMEPIRPKVDAFLLDWLNRTPVKREWFFEQRDGNCRLMSSLAIQLSQTSELWAREVAPFAEGIARSIWTTTSEKLRNKALATRLTQSRKRESKCVSGRKPFKSIPKAQPLCRICGKQISSGDKYCRNCKPIISRENLLEAAKLGRLATHTPEAEALRSQTQRRQMAARKAWNPEDKPNWLDEVVYKTRIQPSLRVLTVSAVIKALDVSTPYATGIRSGRYIPHPRHWMNLANLAGIQK